MKITIDTTLKKIIIGENCSVTELQSFLKKAIPAKELKDYKIEYDPILINQPIVWPWLPVEPFYPQPWYENPPVITCSFDSSHSFMHSSIHALTH